jgi:hypothetical protein
MVTESGFHFNYVDDGEWAACTTCAGFIRSENRSGLMAWCLRVGPRNFPMPVTARGIRQMIELVFWPHYANGGTIEVESG